MARKPLPEQEALSPTAKGSNGTRVPSNLPLSNRCPEVMRARAISASRACECCLAASQKGAGRVGQLILDLMSAMATGDPSLDIVADPRDKAVTIGFVSKSPTTVRMLASDPVVRGVPAGGAGALGAVLLLGGGIAAQIASQDATLAVLEQLSNAVPTLVGLASRYGADSCHDCIAKRVWNQNSPQVRLKGPYRTRKP